MGGSSLGPAVLAAVRDSLGPSAAGASSSATRPIPRRRLGLAAWRTPSSSSPPSPARPSSRTCSSSYARSRVSDPARYAVITDPGHAASHRGAASSASGTVFENQPDIGGRYSVLSYFGLVPGRPHGLRRRRAVRAGPRRRPGGGGRARRRHGQGGAPGPRQDDHRRRRADPLVRPLGRTAHRRVDRQARPGMRPRADDRGRTRRRPPPASTSPSTSPARSARSSSASSSRSPSAATASRSTPSTSRTSPSRRRTHSGSSAPCRCRRWRPRRPRRPMALISSKVRPNDYVSLQAYLPYGQDDSP